MMRSPLLVLLVAAALLAGCASAQRGAMLRAYSAIGEGRYEDALKRLHAAESYVDPSPALMAEIKFLQARSYDGMKQVPEAIGAYRYVIATYPQSIYAYQAKARLDIIDPAAAPPAVGAAAPVAAGADAPPLVLFQVRPVYPKELAEKKVSGTVVVDFVVEVDGSVSAVRAIRAANDKFEEEAIACVKQWKFKPAIKDGKPARARMQVPITFDVM